jgi:hypothetical protein
MTGRPVRSTAGFGDLWSFDGSNNRDCVVQLAILWLAALQI